MPGGPVRLGAALPPRALTGTDDHLTLRAVSRHALLSLALGLAAAIAGCRTEPTTRRLVLITLDTLRFDSLEGAPGRTPAMPLVKAWAGKNLRFARCYATTSATQPTHATLFTGLPPWRSGVTRNGEVLEERHEVLAERLRAAGWSTTAVVASVPLSSPFGFGQGFERYEEAFDRGTVPRWEGYGLRPGSHFYTLSAGVVDRALAAIDEASGDRQFFWFHFFDAHAPYGDAAGVEPVREEALQRAALRNRRVPVDLLARARDLYDADVHVLDAALARLLDRLARDARTHATTIVLTSDHGESFGEDGTLGHGKDVSEVQNHVPCVLAGPGIRPEIRRDVADSTDLFATLLARSGLAPAPGPGRDLLATSTGPAVVGMRRTYAGTRDIVRADGATERVEGNRFFAVLPDGTFLRSRGLEFDPPVALDPAVRDGVLARFRAASEDLAVLAARAPRGLPPEVEEQLRALGYVP